MAWHMRVSRRTLPLRNMGRGMRLVVVSLLLSVVCSSTAQRFSGALVVWMEVPLQVRGPLSRQRGVRS